MTAHLSRQNVFGDTFLYKTVTSLGLSVKLKPVVRPYDNLFTRTDHFIFEKFMHYSPFNYVEIDYGGKYGEKDAGKIIGDIFGTPLESQVTWVPWWKYGSHTEEPVGYNVITYGNEATLETHSTKELPFYWIFQNLQVNLLQLGKSIRLLHLLRNCLSLN